MARTVGIGHQNFEQLLQGHNFYVDKTLFVKEWWENNDVVTLITRPRRFGKTLTMSMVEQFFSIEYADRGDLFEGMAVWEEEKYRKLQGSYPVISISFAKVKEKCFSDTRKKICQIITRLYNKYDFLLDSNCLNEKEKQYYGQISAEMEDYLASDSLNVLSDYLERYFGKKVIILLDEYDTPMQEAYVNGYWRELADFTRNLFNATFKSNPYLERAIMTGITRVGRESIFSDLNNLEVVTTTSEMYANCFGFTEEEVRTALTEYGLADRIEQVKEWYDGFAFGKHKSIYNPWSILNFLKEGKFASYWANTSSNSLIGDLIRRGSQDLKIIMEDLLEGKSFQCQIDEQIVFGELDNNESAIWSFLVAGGYLKVEGYELADGHGKYDLRLTNREVVLMFEKMIKNWFAGSAMAYNRFIKALLLGDVDAMNDYMNRITREIFSYFDLGKKPAESIEPERFYHGFVLGLMVELEDRYRITSNRESGFGRYDIMMEPRKSGLDAFIIEFKVCNPRKKMTLEEAVQSALQQIDEKQYETSLRNNGIEAGRIRKYGFAFEGKNVLIG